MKSSIPRPALFAPVIALVLTASSGRGQDQQAPSAADPGWPRVFTKDDRTLTVYQPQVDKWDNYSRIHYRMAIAIKGVTPEEKFGVVEADANTLVEQSQRSVVMYSTSRDIRFANTSDADAASLRAAIDGIVPVGQMMTFSLDRVLACLEPGQQSQQKPVAINLDPPPILYSAQPAILVMFMGEPQLKPVDKDKPDLMFAVNTNWDIFFDVPSGAYFLLNQDSWLTAPDPKGPWTPVANLPSSLSALPDNDNWANVRANIPGKPSAQPPQVFTATKPTELILTAGDPTYSPIPGTRLMRVANTDSTLFRDLGDNRFYFLVAGRWFRAASLDGPWSAASNDLPPDFARIPDDSPAAFVKASVPGTRDSKDAVMLASVPSTTTVDLTKAVQVPVEYKGEPRFKPIERTSVQYAVNSPYTVLLVGGKYYVCDQGVWFIGGAATGPWSYCTEVPPAIYTIPPTSPVHNVTYVTVQSSGPETVVYSQTAGYSGEYVAANGVLMFGAGLIAGAAIADHYNDCCYPAAAYYSYGCGAVYHYGYGGYYGAARAAYGPYGGIAYGAAYNPATGVYSRGAQAYGPYGSAGVRQAYNPYTGTYAAAGYRATPYGTASGARAYNPYTGATAAGGRVSTAYGSAGRMAAYNPTTGNAIAGGYRSGPAGSAGAVATNQGTGVAAWNTPYNQGAVAKTNSGNIYAANDGTVYKKDEDGWSKNTGNGWESPPQPQPRSASQRTQATTAGFDRESLERQAQARERGSFQSDRARSWQPQERSGGYSRGGGGGGGRRRR